MELPFDLNSVCCNFLSESEDAVLIIDNSGVIQYHNRSVSELFPLQDKSPVGMTLKSFLLEGVNPVISQHTCFKNQESGDEEFTKPVELHIIHGTGAGNHVEFRTIPFRNDQGTWTVGYFRRITRWKDTEYKLVLSEERFRIIFKNLFDSIIVYPLDSLYYPGRLIEVNTSTCTRLGYDRSELLARSPLDIVPAEEIGKLLSFIKKFKVRRKQSCELLELAANGDIIPVEVNALCVQIRNDRLVIQISRDISDRRSLDQLQKRAFEQINKNLEQFAILNDKIRNPLSIIMTLASFDETRENELIQKQVEIIDKIVDELDNGWMESEKVRNYLKRYFAD